MSKILEVVASLRPTTPEEREEFSLGEGSSTCEIGGLRYFCDLYDPGGAGGAPTIWAQDESVFWGLQEVEYS